MQTAICSGFEITEGVGHKPDYVLTRRIVDELLRMVAPPLRVVARASCQPREQIAFKDAAE